MSAADRNDVVTVPIADVKGNALFEKAVAATELDDATMRWLLFSALKTIGSTPAKFTPDELGSLLPEIDRRLRKLMQDAQADLSMKRLFHVLFDQAEVA
jgi:hypothetical protein